MFGGWTGATGVRMALLPLAKVDLKSESQLGRIFCCILCYSIISMAPIVKDHNAM